MAFKLDRRSQGRKRVNMLAALKRGRDIFSCHIVELSDGGARIALVDEAASVVGAACLTSAELGEIEAEVVWQRGSLAGLRFTAAPKRGASAFRTSLPGPSRSKAG